MTEAVPTAIKAETDVDRWHSLNTALMHRCLSDAFRLFGNNGLEPVLIKGWAAARFYPDHIYRHATDLDLAFSSNDFDAADRVYRAGETSCS